MARPTQKEVEVLQKKIEVLELINTYETDRAERAVRVLRDAYPLIDLTGEGCDEWSLEVEQRIRNVLGYN